MSEKNEYLTDDVVHQDDEALSSYVVKQNVGRRKRFSMYLTILYFKSKFIKFSIDFIYNWDLNMITYNEEARKVLPNDK